MSCTPSPLPPPSPLTKHPSHQHSSSSADEDEPSTPASSESSTLSGKGLKLTISKAILQQAAVQLRTGSGSSKKGSTRGVGRPGEFVMIKHEDWQVNLDVFYNVYVPLMLVGKLRNSSDCEMNCKTANIFRCVHVTTKFKFRQYLIVPCLDQMSQFKCWLIFPATCVLGIDSPSLSLCLCVCVCVSS